LAQRLRCGKPSGAIGFGELHLAAGFGWPLHREQVAAKRCEIAVAFDRPGPHRLSSRLLEAAEIEECSYGAEAGLLFEFALSGGEWIFVALKDSLRDRPGAVVLLGPERPARMHQQELGLRRATAEHQNACAVLRHGVSRKDKGKIGKD